MATVTAFTAERTLAIENKRVDSAAVVGDELILTRKDGTTLNAGNVRGPQGSTGPQGIPGPSLPPGTIISGRWAGEGFPVGYIGMIGQTVANGAIDFPDLAAAWPEWVDGTTDLAIPNMTGATLVGVSQPNGYVSGSMTHQLTEQNLPPHTHSSTHNHAMNHTHGTGSVTGGSHGHILNGSVSNGQAEHTHAAGTNAGEFIVRDTAYTSGFAIPYNTAQTNGVSPIAIEVFASTTPALSTHAHPDTFAVQTSTSHSHSVTIPAWNGVTSDRTMATDEGFGISEPVDHTPRNLGVRFAVKT